MLTPQPAKPYPGGGQVLPGGEHNEGASVQGDPKPELPSEISTSDVKPSWKNAGSRFSGHAEAGRAGPIVRS